MKTEVAVSRRKKKQLNCDLNLKLYGKKFQPSNYLRYLGIYIDEYLNVSPLTISQEWHLAFQVERGTGNNTHYSIIHRAHHSVDPSGEKIVSN